VTSGSGNGDLATWPDAISTGVAAANEICRAHAARAGLDGDFVAWISDSTSSARCRLLGQSGASCPAAAAGPWARMDGVPFALDPDGLLDPLAVIAPIGFNERGEPVASDYWTGTEPSGALGVDCDDWSLTTGSGVCGSPLHTHSRWTSILTPSCAANLRLACVERGAGPALDYPPAVSDGRTLFVTSTTGPGRFLDWGAEAGGLDGVAGADRVCQARASAAGRPSPSGFRALLITSTVDRTAELSDDVVYRRVDGVRVGTGLELRGAGTFNPLTAPIALDELGVFVEGTVWVGSAASACGDFLDDTLTGRAGRAESVSGSWRAATTEACDSLHRIYCFE